MSRDAAGCAVSVLAPSGSKRRNVARRAAQAAQICGGVADVAAGVVGNIFLLHFLFVWIFLARTLAG